MQRPQRPQRPERPEPPAGSGPWRDTPGASLPPAAPHTGAPDVKPASRSAQFEDAAGAGAERVRLRRGSYRQIAAVGGLVALVATLGYLGTLGAAPRPPAPELAVASPSTATASAGPIGPAFAETARPTLPLPREDDLTPLPPNVLPRSRIALPGAAGVDVVTAPGNLYYVPASRASLEAVTLTGGGSPRTIAVASECHAILEIAAAGGRVAYLEAAEPWLGAPPGSECPSAGPIQWRMVLVDAKTGRAREVASGSEPIGSDVVPDSGAAALHIALDDSAYAFVRDDSSGSGGRHQTVEVHGVGDDRLLWASPTDQPVLRLMLGGTRLAAILDVGDPYAINGKGSTLRLVYSDAGRPGFVALSNPSQSASISPDGEFITWDEPASWTYPAALVMAHAFATDETWQVSQTPAADGGSASSPTVTVGPCGPVFAWVQAGSPSAGGIALDDPCWPLGALITGTGEARWLGLQDGQLVWLSGAQPAPSVFVMDTSPASLFAMPPD